MTSPARARTRRTGPRKASALPEAPRPGYAPIDTERLAMRAFVPEDAGALHRLINDWEVTRNLAVVPFPYPRDLADNWIASTRRQIDAGTAYHLAITGKEGTDELLLGAIGLNIDAKTRRGKLGYWVGRRFWGHGVGTEAATRFVRWAFANLDIEGIDAAVFTDNPASMTVLRRIGFREIGEGMERSLARGGEAKVLGFAATRDDIFGRTEVPPQTSLPIEPEGKMPLLLVAACALIDTDNRVLLARRPEGKKMAGLWEFPGGKLDPGETPEAALIRELKEELGIDVSAACLAPFAFASHAYEGFHLLMPLFLCRRWRGIPKPREGQALAWVRPEKLPTYSMPPADKPLIPLLRDFL
jgi:8-oxo-dGTP diphosphatase